MGEATFFRFGRAATATAVELEATRTDHQRALTHSTAARGVHESTAAVHPSALRSARVNSGGASSRAKECTSQHRRCILPRSGVHESTAADASSRARSARVNTGGASLSRKECTSRRERCILPREACTSRAERCIISAQGVHESTGAVHDDGARGSSFSAMGRHQRKKGSPMSAMGTPFDVMGPPLPSILPGDGARRNECHPWSGITEHRREAPGGEQLR